MYEKLHVLYALISSEFFFIFLNFILCLKNEKLILDRIFKNCHRADGEINVCRHDNGDGWWWWYCDGHDDNNWLNLWWFYILYYIFSLNGSLHKFSIGYETMKISWIQQSNHTWINLSLLGYLLRSNTIYLYMMLTTIKIGAQLWHFWTKTEFLQSLVHTKGG